MLWERNGRISHPRSLLHELDFFQGLGFAVYLVGTEQDEAGVAHPGPLLHLSDETYQDVFEPKDKKLVLTFMAVRVERWAGALTALKRHKGVGRGYIPQGLRFIVACKLSRAGGWGAGTIRHEKLTIASHGVQLHACTTGAGYTLPERARSATACRQ